MSIIRLIFVTVPADEIAEALKDWRTECAPIMLRQQGCVSEQLFQDVQAPGDFISYSEWEDEAAIDAYLQSADHQEIKRNTGKLTQAKVSVKTYKRSV